MLKKVSVMLQEKKILVGSVVFFTWSVTKNKVEATGLQENTGLEYSAHRQESKSML